MTLTTPYQTTLMNLCGNIWSIQEHALQRLWNEVLAADALPPNYAEVPTTPMASAGTRGGGAPGAVAVIPIRGAIVPRGDMFSSVFGGVPLDGLRGEVQRAVSDPQVSTVVLDIDSPGGSVTGVQEFADFLHTATTAKPIIAHCNAMCASAAYWIASQATEIVATPSATVGGIGVFAVHQDVSESMKAQGITNTIISAGRRKTEGNPFEPLSDDARSNLQATVNEHYDMFVDAVSRGRAVAASSVRTGFGEGAVVSGDEAMATNLVDRIQTMEGLLTELTRPRGTRPRGVSADDAVVRRWRYVA